MTRIRRGTTRRLVHLAVAAGVVVAGQGSARAQECVGFLERFVASGGVNGVNSVFAGDLDGDGDVDVLSASHSDGKIAWFENDGATPPGFRERVVSTGARGASSVFASDVDGDLDLDVLSTSRNDDEVSWYENDGLMPPGFRERPLTTEAGTPVSVFAVDLDGDGDVDVLSASFSSNTVAWFENAGSVFTERTVATDVRGATAVSAADLDDDGDTDVVATSQLDDRVVWFENDGATPPDFTRRDLPSTLDGPVAVHTADLDGDLDVDVLAASIGDNRVVWYDNDGAGTFTENDVATPAGPRSVFAADVDGDGDLDVLCASDLDDTVAWYENPGFAEHVISSTAVSADAVHAADLDGDMDVDVLSASSTPGTGVTRDRLTWYENDGAQPLPGLTERIIARSSNGAGDLVVADLDGDGDPDLVTAAGEEDVVWYDNDGAPVPAFVPRSAAPPASALATATVAIAVDLDGDPDADLDVVVASSEQDVIVWRENVGGSPPAFVEHPLASGVASPRALHAVDLDGNGRMDVLSASFEDDTIAWHDNGGGTFTKRDVSTEADGASGVWAADLDGDGDLDVLSASFEDDTIAWHESDGLTPPGFTKRIVSEVAVGAVDVAAADLDFDGDLDVVSASATDTKVSWYESVPDPDDAEALAFVERVIALVPSVSSIRISDVDRDGDPDVVSVSSSGHRIAWHENDGEMPPVFLSHSVPGSAVRGRRVATADLDDDGRTDLAVAFDSQVAWYAQAGEICSSFDASGDGVIDGVELAWLSRAFGSTSADPASEWWFAIDFNRDGVVDGDDLAILAGGGVWGRTPDTCAYSCL